MKKILFVCLLSCLSLFSLASCSPQETPEPPSESETVVTGATTGVVTDFQSSDTELHETIVPWEFEEGEEVDNLYYCRTVSDNGVPVYAVERASDNQVVYLPMSQTVVYASESENCYFERTTLTYALDGEPKEVVQYQLHVTALVNNSVSDETPEVTEDPGATE